MRAILTVLFLALVGAFVGLGFWQLDRAEQKRELFGAFDAGSGGAAATALIEGDALAEHRYERLRLHGRFLSSRQILLDWVTHAGRVGYQVLTPFRPDGSERWIVVNRGWIAAAPDRGQLPAIDVGEDDRTITGQIDALPRPGLRLDVPEEPGSQRGRALCCSRRSTNWRPNSSCRSSTISSCSPPTSPTASSASGSRARSRPNGTRVTRCNGSASPPRWSRSPPS